MISLRSWLKQQTEPSTSKIKPLEFEEVEKEIIIDGVPQKHKVKVFKSVDNEYECATFGKDDLHKILSKKGYFTISQSRD